MAELLQIVEVDARDKVRCCAPGCGHSVYKRIHVVRDGNEILVVGQTCYRKIYLGEEISSASYFSGNARKLSHEERKLLTENTEALIDRIRSEYLKAQEERVRQPAKRYEHRPIESRQSKPPRKSYTPGPMRTVRCIYCGNEMQTDIPHKPAKGFKCQRCKDGGATEPLASRRRRRSQTRM